MSIYNSHTKLDSIPVVDLSRSGDEECFQAVREACEEWGCFRIVNHGIESDLIQSANMVCRDVFKLSVQTKMKNVSPNPVAGYFGGLAHQPFYESVGIAGIPNADAIQGFCDVLWPQGNHKFCKVMQDYISKTMDLSNRIHQIILESLGVSKYYASHFNHGKAMLRMNMYDVSADRSPECIDLGPHTDVYSITLVNVDKPDGLQVLNKAEKWVDVEAAPYSFVVFAGDGYEAWSNGRIHSAYHRVVVKRQESRLALAFFSMIPDEMEIKAPAELVDEEHPQRYRAFRFKDLVEYRLKEGKGKKEPLKPFAGIISTST